MALDLAIALLLSCGALLVSVQQGLPLMIPLVVALVVMTGLYWRRGKALQQLIQLMRQGAAQSISVLTILLLIGAVIASWLISGTVPALVYYGLQLLHPRWFLVSGLLADWRAVGSHRHFVWNYRYPRASTDDRGP